MDRKRLPLMSAILLGMLPLAGCGDPAVDHDTDPGGTTPAFGDQSIDYFLEIAFGAEYGDNTPVIHRWTEDVAIAVHGAPTDDDLATLRTVVSEINDLIDTVEVSITESNPNVEMYIVPESVFALLDPDYVEGNIGFASFWWDAMDNITQVTILVSTDVDQTKRNHIIREEVTQALGLMRDSYTYPDSIFFQERSEVQEYLDIDEDVIAILYLPEITSGMTPDEALAVIPRP